MTVADATDATDTSKETQKAERAAHLASVKKLMVANPKYEVKNITLIPINEWVAINSRDSIRIGMRDLYRLVALKDGTVNGDFCGAHTALHKGQIGGYVGFMNKSPRGYANINKALFWVDDQSTCLVYDHVEGEFLIVKSHVAVNRMCANDRIYILKSKVETYSIKRSSICNSYVRYGNIENSSLGYSICIHSQLDNCMIDNSYVTHSTLSETDLANTFANTIWFRHVSASYSYLKNLSLINSNVSNSYIWLDQPSDKPYRFNLRWGIVNKQMLTMRRADGYEFVVGNSLLDGKVMISAGCRYFSIAEAITHWKQRRPPSHPLSKQTRIILKLLPEINGIKPMPTEAIRPYKNRMEAFAEFSTTIGKGNNEWFVWDAHRASNEKLGED